MKTSARNQFLGAVEALHEGRVNVEVLIRLGESQRLVATVTRESVHYLGLHPGCEILALVKASAVLLAAGSDARTTARNQLWGEVCRIHEGEVSAEVVIALPSGQYVTAVVTLESLVNLALTPGKPACALFPESAIILAVGE